jgi:glycerophosphoryl diester phosphodiesterase
MAPDWLTARPIAHRGLHDRSAGRIENARASFAAAVDSAFAMECDVQISADGEAMVFHDFELGRLTEDSGRVDQQTAAALGAIRLTGGEDRIDTLGQLLDQVGGRQPIVVEIKSRFDGDLRLTRRVVEVVKDRDQPIALKSFDPRIVAALRMLMPDRPRGIVAMLDYSYPDYETIAPGERHAMANLLHFSETDPDFISWRVRDLPSGLPYLCRAVLGRPVMTWTVRTPEDRALASAHADQMVFEGFLP